MWALIIKQSLWKWLCPPHQEDRNKAKENQYLFLTNAADGSYNLSNVFHIFLITMHIHMHFKYFWKKSRAFSQKNMLKTFPSCVFLSRQPFHTEPVTLNTSFTAVLGKPEQTLSLPNMCPGRPPGDLCVLGTTIGCGVRLTVGQPMPFPLLPIPIMNLLLPDESIRFPRPATQGSIYLID